LDGSGSAYGMLRIMFVLLSKKQPYRDPGVDYEALMVKRNAPRCIKALAKYGYAPTATGESGR